MKNNSIVIAARAMRPLLCVLATVFLFSGCKILFDENDNRFGNVYSGLTVSVTLSHTQAEVGQEITIDATVTNRGGGRYTTTTLVYYSSADRVISPSDPQISTDFVPSLAFSEINRQSHSLSYNSEGTRYIGACIFSGAVCSAGVQITIGAASAPDLTISTTLSHTYAEVNRAITVEATVINGGDRYVR